MSTASCGCAYYGNQHGTFFRPCDRHGVLFAVGALTKNETPEEFLNRMLTEYIENHQEELTGL